MVQLSPALAQAQQLIDGVDLSCVIERLVHIENWSRRDAVAVVAQYRRYLFLRKKYPSLDLPPSKGIDEAWHAHILHTEEYRAFCKQAFGDQPDHYLDHHPHRASATSLAALEQAFEETQRLYYEEFGEHIYKIMGRSFWERCLECVRAALVKKYPKWAGSIGE